MSCLRAVLLLLLVWLPVCQTALGRGWPTVRAALETFQQATGSPVTSIPYSFTVPSSPSWPPATHGLRLGQIVSRIRNRGDYAAHAVELQALGLYPRDVTAEATEDADFDIFLRAVWAWRAQHEAAHKNSTSASSLPKVKYRIPADASFPASLHGYPLGSRVEQLRRGLRFSSTEHRAHLKDQLPPSVLAALSSCPPRPPGPSSPHFSSRPPPALLRTRLSPSLLLEALRSYQAMHGDLNVPYDFVVPWGDVAWPAGLWGVRLGQRVVHVRNRGSFREIRGEIDAIGAFPWVVTRDRAFLDLLSNLTASFGSFGAA